MVVFCDIWDERERETYGTSAYCYAAVESQSIIAENFNTGVMEQEKETETDRDRK